jgi:phage/plasmid-associated DNA primase
MPSNDHAFHRMLEKVRLTSKDTMPPTHTSMSGGSYYVMGVNSKEFIENYGSYIESVGDGPLPSLVERHRHISCVVVDIDLRHWECERQYSNDDVFEFAMLLGARLRDVVVSSVKADWDCYVLEKPAPRPVKTNSKSKGGDGEIRWKDGVHLVFPGLITCPTVQRMIRDSILSSKPAPRLLTLPSSLTGPEDVYDEAVIERNGWMMYGSKKPDEPHPWVLSRVINILTGEEHADDSVAELLAHPGELARILSIRKYCHDNPLTDHGAVLLNRALEAEEGEHRIPTEEPASASTGTATMSCSELSKLSALVSILSDSRAEPYEKWLNVGFALFTVTSGSSDGLHLWKEFGSRCPGKYDDQSHDKKWYEIYRRPKTSGCLGMGSLVMWAKEDNLEKTKRWMSENAVKKIITEEPKDHNLNKVALISAIKASDDRYNDLDADSTTIETVRDGIRFTWHSPTCKVEGFVHRNQQYRIADENNNLVGFLIEKFDINDEINIVTLHKNLSSECKYECTLNSVTKATMQGKSPHEGTMIEFGNINSTAGKYAIVRVPDMKVERVTSKSRVDIAHDALNRSLDMHAARKFGITNNLFIVGNTINIAENHDNRRSVEDIIECVLAANSDFRYRVRCSVSSKSVNSNGLYYCSPETNVWDQIHNMYMEELLSVIFQHTDDMNAVEKKYVRSRRGREDAVRVLAAKVFEKGFEHSLDADLDFFALDNGIVDTSSGVPVFRPIVRDDMVSMTTGWSYSSEEAREYRSDVDLFLSQIFPIPEELDVVFKFFASLLSGRRHAKKFLVLTDRKSGNNGKSTFSALLFSLFGCFCSVEGTKFVCCSSIVSGRNSHDAGMERMRSVRLLLAEEMKSNMHMDVALMKKITGGEEVVVQGRSFGSDNAFKFTWQAGCVLIFNEGDCPQFDSSDGAFMHRLMIAPMRSKFVSRNPSTNPGDHEFSITESIKKNFPQWRSALLDILMDNFKGNKDSAFDQLPSSMTSWKQEILTDANPLSEWISSVTEVTGNKVDYVTAAEMKAVYRNNSSLDQRLYKTSLVTAYFKAIPDVYVKGVDKCHRRDAPTGEKYSQRDVIRGVKFV